MKAFSWQDLLRGHPVFSALSEEEIANLLRGEVSQEQVYPLYAEHTKIWLVAKGTGKSWVERASLPWWARGRRNPILSVASI